jgi:Peptidase S24-like
MNKERPENSTFRLLASNLIAGGYGLRFQAKGRSMMPTIQDGEIVHVKPIASDILRIGDIVLLRRGEEFKAHRIIRKRGSLFITRGDAGVGTDGEIRSDQILGMVIAKEPIGSRQLVRLDGVAARLIFFASEARRRASSLLASRRKHRNGTANAS